MTQEDYNSICITFQSFLKEVYDWNVFCNKIEKDTSLSNDEIQRRQKSKIADIVTKHCTSKKRVQDIPNCVSYYVMSENDKPIQENILRIEESVTNKAILYSKREDTLQSEYQYVFIRKNSKWLIDSKKRYSQFKQKWVSASLGE